MGKLLNLPNIDSRLEQKLIDTGIDSPEKLREKGSRNVFFKIKAADSSACFTMLLALEGAVRGVLVEDLNNETTEELKEFMEVFNR